MKVALLIRSLEIGGAERQLVILARGLCKRGYEVRVLTFYPGGALRGELEAAGVHLIDLAKRGRWDVAGFLSRVVKTLLRERPGVIYSFLPTANLVGLIAGRLAQVPRIVWGVRASNMDLALYDRLSRVEMWLSGRLARFASKIICNSLAGAEHHVQLGYPATKLHVIENGVDTDRFYFDAAERERVRAEWRISPGEILIGLPARLDPMKDHKTALQAFLLLGIDWPAAKLVCVGAGPLSDSLRALSISLGLENRVIWAGVRVDMPAVYSAFDLASSSSYGEGFSNTLAEAMACECVCVATDVGDSAKIVGDTGWVVPAKAPEALALAWRQALTLTANERSSIGAKARQRIEENFSISIMVQRTLEVLQG